MDDALRARIEDELPRGRWTPDNHAKLVDFLATYAREAPGRPVDRPFALFDADNTTWTGDIGDAAFVFALRNMRLSPRLHELLPERIDVPAQGFGVSVPGRLFPRARVQAALAAMTSGEPATGNARRIYAGTILGVYNLLDTSVGSVAFDFADARVATPLYGDAVRDFYKREIEGGDGDLAPFGRPDGRGGYDVLFPAIVDTGEDQRALRARGQLGAYTQVAAWVGLDKSADEVRHLALQVWDESPPVDTPFDEVFPIDAAGATSPAPLDFSADPSFFVPGGRPAAGVVLGTSSMTHGTRIRPEIADLMAAMARHGVTPVVITASHVELVRGLLERRYGVDPGPLTGMLPAVERGAYGGDMTAPATFRPGKVDAARAIARTLTGDEDARPVFCAGDSNTDLEMVAYSTGYRLFFDRGKRPLMALAEHLASRAAATTLIQPPF
jgi:hypothetical protein